MVASRKPYSGASAIKELKEWLEAEKIMDNFPESEWEAQINLLPLNQQDKARKDIYEEKGEIEDSHKKKLDWEKVYPERYK